jgi:ABC-2 type transport system permease protein
VVAHLVRLKLRLLGNGLRRSAWQIVGLAVAALYGLGIVMMALGGLVALSTQDAEFIRTILVLAGALLVLGWWVLPVIAFGVDETLDPARFVTFSIPRRPLLTGLALGGVVGVPGITTALVGLTTAVTWRRHPVAIPFAIIGAMLALAICVVGARATTSLLAPLVTRRRFREVVAAVVVVPLFLLGPIMSVLGRGISSNQDVWPGLARAAGWTPFGAPWALAADVSDGAWGAAALKVAICAATLAALVAAWSWALDASLDRGGGTGPTRSRTHGLGFFGWLPPTPTGAVAARCLTYWTRDSRYAISVAIVPLMPVMLWFTFHGGAAMLALGPVVAYMMAWIISADIAYDSTAFWMHVGAPIRGRTDRTGRVWATGMLGLPVVLVMTVLSLALTGRWDATVPVLGLALGVQTSALGVASVVSARFVYQVPKAGESPFTTKQGGSTASLVSQTVGGFVLIVLVLPEAVLGIVAIVGGSMLWGALALVVGVGLGGSLLVVGVRLGGDLYDRRAPELLQTMMAFA